MKIFLSNYYFTHFTVIFIIITVIYGLPCHNDVDGKAVIQSGKVHDGPCPEMETYKTYDWLQLVGEWFTGYMTPKDDEKFFYRCAKGLYSLDFDGSFLADFYFALENGWKFYHVNVTYRSKPNETGYSQEFGDTPEDLKIFLNDSSNLADLRHFTLIDTDYENYGITHGCYTLGQNHHKFATQILYREPFPSEEIVAKSKEYFKTHKMEVILKKVDHRNCTYE